jgi:hypothetical protein
MKDLYRDLLGSLLALILAAALVAISLGLFWLAITILRSAAIIAALHAATF